MDRLIDLTREYLLARKQFGRVFASNQVIQHRLVDLWVAAAANLFGEESWHLERLAADDDRDA
jgi:alkylation response protein AidB-like acyl-CoA dehydrogenase